MLSFSQFNKKTKKKLSDGDAGAPVYVQHGSHSHKKHSLGTPVYVQHGSHAHRKKKLTESGYESLEGEKYDAARQKTVNHLLNANDHISKEGPDGVHDKLSKHYDKNPHAKGHFSDYADSSHELNYALHRHHVEGPKEGHKPGSLPPADEYDISHKHIKGLDKALTHHKTPKRMTVFSGVGFHPGMAAAQHPKGHVHMPSYTSTSIHPHEAANFAKALPKGSPGDNYQRYSPAKDRKKEGADHHIMKINLPKGHHGAYIADHSWIPDEKEFLLPRNQRMKIHPTPEVKEFKHGKATHRMHIWSATPVSDKKKAVAVPKGKT